MGKMNIIEEISRLEGGMTETRMEQLQALGWYDLLVARNIARVGAGV